MNHLTVSKWGNSLGIRIPKHIVESLKIDQNSIFEYDSKENQLILKKVPLTYNEILNNCETVTTTQNQEVWNDSVVGNELF